MEKYWEGVKNTEEIDRGLYIILPLRYQGDFQKIPFSAKKQIQTRIINQMKKRIAPDLILMIFWKFYP